MTHLYIEQATDRTEEVNSSIISKLYELAISGDLDNTSDLKGRLHSSTAKEKHVTYLNNNFDELYISADTQYLSFEDPDIETYMKRYIGTDDGVSVLDIQTFVASGTAFGASYNNTHGGGVRPLFLTDSERNSIDSFDEISLFNGITTLDSMFLNGSNISSILIPSSVSILKSWAFSNCTSLTSVTGLSNVTSLETGVFYNCPHLKNTDLNFENLTSLGLQAFEGCISYSFGDLDLSNISTIKLEIFKSCKGITKVTLGNNTTIDGSAPFYDCSNITLADLGTGITIGPNGTYMFSRCTNLESVTGLSNITEILTLMFSYCSSLAQTDIDWSKIRTISDTAFIFCENYALSSLSIPNLTSLGAHAFDHSKITSVSNLGSITIVADSCFENCGSLTSVIVPLTCSTIGGSAFNGCTNLTSVQLPSTISIKNYAFYNCGHLLSAFDQNETSVTINFPNEGSNCFCNNYELVFPQTVTITTTSNITGKNSNLLKNAFDGTTMFDIVIDLSVKNISEECFYGTHFTSISAPYVEYISSQCFRYTDAVTIDLPSVVGWNGNNEYAIFANCQNLEKVSLGHYAEMSVPNTYDNGRSWFYNCPKIKTLDIGDSVTKITVGDKGSVFDQTGNPSMREYIIRNTTVPTLVLDISLNWLTANIIMRSFGGTQSKIYVPDSALNDYKTANNWSIIASYIYPLSDIEPTT